MNAAVDFLPDLFPFFTGKPKQPYLSDMGLHHRKLMPEICESICHVEQNCSSDCEVCLKLCLTNPQYYYYSQPPPLPPTPQVPSSYLDEEGHQGKHHTISIYLVLALSLLAFGFFVACCCAIYTRFFSRRRVSSNQQTQETRDDFLDEEHGPVVDHPIWYIRTPGLQESIINAIAVCKYRKGEGLIEGTECSVCLSEFQEDENLRLLPKCNHAFHLPCIDTWLRSHTNCPMCRAPIVTNPARIPSMEPNAVESSSLENTRMELVENNSENIGGMENSASELRNGVEEEGQLEAEDVARVSQTERLVAEGVSIRPRRSVSLDSSSAANINLALASFLSVESDSDSNRVLGDANEQIGSKRVTGNENLLTASKGRSSSFRIRYLHGVPSSMKRSRSYNGKYLLSRYSRSQTQKKPNATLRSF